MTCRTWPGRARSVGTAFGPGAELPGCIGRPGLATASSSAAHNEIILPFASVMISMIPASLRHACLSSASAKHCPGLQAKFDRILRVTIGQRNQERRVRGRGVLAKPVDGDDAVADN